MKRLKDKKIIVYEKTSAKNSNGFMVNSYKPIHSGKLWAYTRQLSQKEFYAAATLQNQEETLFTVNWRNDITTGMYVLYKSKWYKIVRIDPFEGYKENLTLYVTEATGTALPKADEILPY